MNFSGLLLAGGKSTRFGISKLKINVGPLPLLADQVLKLSFFCSDLVISTSGENYLQVSGYLKKIVQYFCWMAKGRLSEKHPNPSLPKIKIVKDEELLQGTGPITGIYSGLKHIKRYHALVLAADMPLVSYRLFDMLAKEAGNNLKDAYIIDTEKGFEVLCGLYSKSCLPVIEKNINTGIYKISDSLRELDVGLVDEKSLRSHSIDNMNFFNINTRMDFKRFKEIWKGSTGGIAGFRKKWAYFYFR